jgi:hypothetical protein
LVKPRVDHETVASGLPARFFADALKRTAARHLAEFLAEIGGAPEEIRTPDPQIRRLLRTAVSKALFCKIEDFVAV